MSYTTITIEGGLFPPDLLERIALGDGGVGGQTPGDFGLSSGRHLLDEIQRSFSDARVHWESFSRRLERSRESRTTLTRQNWAAELFELLGFQPLEYQRTAVDVGGASFPISHRTHSAENAPPVHIVAVDQHLDERGPANRRTPHALVQDFLNRSESLWGVVTNGAKLRLLRDSARLSKPTYLEFDIQAMIEGNAYSEFVVLYRLLHATRFPRDGVEPHECLLEGYYTQGIEEGGRVREKLRDGVKSALEVIGTALIEHPLNDSLRNEIRSSRLDETRYYRQLLNFVYRMLFLMVTEERKLLSVSTDTELQAVYDRYYSVTRLRDRAERYFAGDRHGDLWEGLAQTFRVFRDERSARQMGLSPLNGELFGWFACSNIETAYCPNEKLLAAMRHLSTFDDNGVRRRVNYAHLDVEEFGSVYESLLDYRPLADLGGVSGASPRFELAAGTERKQTGSYYTPPELVRELIDSALVPIVEERLADASTPESKEKALLGLRVCDPASGSGHFLLAAARRIARELAKVRTGEEEPPLAEYRTAIRDVVRNCIYAVDKNPLAVDLCKVALWIEGHAAGLPLGFLDHHVKCGDSLVGVSDLSVLTEGIPDDAYKTVTGDDKDAARHYRQRNKKERTGQRGMILEKPQGWPVTLAEDFATFGELEERSPADVQAKEDLYRQLRGSGTRWWDVKTACDLWTYAFFAPLQTAGTDGLDHVPTTDNVRNALDGRRIDQHLRGQATGASGSHPFFHWPLEFPDVFERGGFDLVLGNPPWGQKQIVGEQLVTKFVRGTYGSVSGIFDWFRPFIERELSILRSSGRYGVVLPDTILLKNYEPTRRYLLENMTIESITWWGAVFSAATIDVTTISGALKLANDSHQVHIAVLDPENELNHNVPQREFWSNPRLTFNLFLTPEKRKEIIRLQKYPRLANFFEIHEGVHSGNVRSQLFVPEYLDSSCRPLIARGQEVSPYFIDWSGTYIRLDAVPKRKTKRAYANLGKPSWYEQEKILVRRTGDRIIAALDSESRFTSNNFFLIFPRHPCALQLDGLCALLNSRVMTWYFRTIEPREGRVFAEIKIKHLEELPLPLLDDGTPIDEHRLDNLNLLGRERNRLAVSGSEAEESISIGKLDLDIDFLSQDLLSIEKVLIDQT